MKTEMERSLGFYQAKSQILDFIIMNHSKLANAESPLKVVELVTEFLAKLKPVGK